MALDALSMYEETSFWARDYGPYTPNPPLAESIRADVAIVGGGILGLNTAREFKKDNPDARVVVLEANVVGSGPAGRNAGFTTTLFGFEPQVTKLRWGKTKASEAYRYAIKAVNYTKELIEDNQLDCDYSHPGLLRVAYSKPQVKTLESFYNVFEKLGLAEEMGLRWWSQSDLRNEFNSPMYTIGLSDPHAGLFHPCKLVRELKRLAVAAGVEIYEQTPVDKIARKQNEVVLDVPGATVCADRTLLATNAYTHLIKGLKGARGLQFPTWTAVIVTERLTEQQWASVGWANRQGFQDARQLIHYFRPTADGRILIGGQDFYTRWGFHKNMDFDFAPRIWRGLEAHLKRLFPSLREVKVAYRWSGPCSLNLDMAPEIGYLGDERVIYFTGGFGHGLAICHLNGRLVADLLGSKKTELTEFWIVNRNGIRLPGSLLSYLGFNVMRMGLNAFDRWQERRMPTGHPSLHPASVDESPQSP